MRKKSVIEMNRFGTVCTSCGVHMRDEEIAFFESSSLFGATVENPLSPGSAHGGVGEAGMIGTAWCEYCYQGRTADPFSGSYDFTDPDEVEDPWALDEDHEWYYPG